MPRRPAVKGLLPVADARPGALAYAVGRVDSLFEQALIVTGQRDAAWLGAVRDEVAWRTGCVPLLANSGRLGILASDTEGFVTPYLASRSGGS